VQKPVQWIRDAVKKYGNVQAVYDLYDTFRSETGSTAGFDSYKRAVRKQSLQSGSSSGSVQLSQEAIGPNLSIVSRSHEIRTLEQLLQYTKVDLDEWVVVKHIINSWGSGANENFQVKVWLSRNGSIKYEKEALNDLIKDAKHYAPKYEPIHDMKQLDSGYMFELSLYDHHFGQQSWGEETGSVNYDVKIAQKLALLATEYQLSRAKELHPEKILVIIGNDFFNVNSKEDTTVHGTRQAEDDRWHKTFLAGRRLWVEIIEKCLQIAPVDVVVVPGNHDEERIFYLGDALECWFNNAPEVNIMNGPKKRKYYEWGNCLLGFTHGSEERRGKGVLVNLMATEMPMAWARSKYRVWRKGHLHAASSVAFQILDEELGVREEVMPSMVALDDYHAGKGYSHLRETIGNAWHKVEGRTHQFIYHPPEGM